MKSFEFMGKNIQQAIDKGLKELGKNQEDVDIAVLSEGGLFSKAKVILSYEDENDEFIPKIVEQKNIQKENIEKVITKEKEEIHKIIDKIDKTIEKNIDKQIKNVESEIQTLEKELNTDGVKFVTDLMYNLNITGEMSVEEDDECKTITIKGDNAGKLIGYRGEGLSAIQTLANTIEQKHNRDCKRIIIDIEDYKLKREKSLEALAERLAEKAIKTGQSQKLEPMNAYERRIIHTYLQKNDKIKTYSKGEEPRRFLIIDIVR